MVIDAKDPMAFLQEEMSKPNDQSSGLAPFFFKINDDEKALIRPLLNMSQYVLTHKHEIYNPSTNKFDVAALCAADLVDLEKQCQHCLDAANNKKLASTLRFVLPIYVHAVVNVKTGQPVTYKDKDGNEHNVSGVRLLEMKRTSSILRDLAAFYNESDDHNITGNDFVITRKNIDGDKLQTTYTVTPKAPKPFTEDVPAWTRDHDQVLLQYAEACPPKFVEDEKPIPASVPPAQATNGNSNGKVKSVPDF